MSKSKNIFGCKGPFVYGHSRNPVCVHGWATEHSLTAEEVYKTDSLFSCGLLPARQNVEILEEPIRLEGNYVVPHVRSNPILWGQFCKYAILNSSNLELQTRRASFDRESVGDSPIPSQHHLCWTGIEWMIVLDDCMDQESKSVHNFRPPYDLVKASSVHWV